MRWTNTPTTAARRLPRSGTPARQAEHRGAALPELRREDVVRPVDPGPGADRDSAAPIGTGGDVSEAVNPEPKSTLDPARDLGLLRLRHVDRA